MSSPIPPSPAPPRRSNSTLLGLLIGIAILLVVIIGIGIFAAVAIARNLHVHQTANGVDLQSPLGSLSVNGDGADLSRVGLPVYPGAVRVEDESDSAFQNGMNINGQHMPGASVHLRAFGAGLDVDVLEYQTPAASQPVLDFYRKKLSTYGSVEQREESTGTITLSVKDAGDQGANVRAVGVKTGSGGTHFALVRVVAGSEAK